MSDAYQAVYDAFPTQDIANAIEAIKCEMLRPSITMRPSLSIDGNQWCALYGEDLQSGVAGFGDSPDEAMRNFEIAWYEKLTPKARN